VTNPEVRKKPEFLKPHAGFRLPFGKINKDAGFALEKGE
jgi:hypothetical protein